MTSLTGWILFHVLILFFLALDLGAARRRHAAPGMRHAVVWSAVWIGLGVAFWGHVHITRGADAGLAYLTGYLIEKSLSVDNLFVFAVLFSRLAVPEEHRHALLHWGVLGALVMRGAMVLGGSALVQRFDWVIPIFGVLLLVAAWRMTSGAAKAVDPQESPVFRWLTRRFPSTERYEGGRFFTRAGPTRLFVALVLIELTDVVFALDSVPAVFAVTTDPFLVYTSNALALLGLRSLFFVLAHGMRRLPLLEKGLGLMLAFIGLKMVFSEVFHIPTVVSLGVIAGVLAAAIAASLLTSQPEGQPAEEA